MIVSSQSSTFYSWFVLFCKQLTCQYIFLKNQFVNWMPIQNCQLHKNRYTPPPRPQNTNQSTKEKHFLFNIIMLNEWHHFLQSRAILKRHLKCTLHWTVIQYEIKFINSAFIKEIARLRSKLGTKKSPQAGRGSRAAKPRDPGEKERGAKLRFT